MIQQSLKLKSNRADRPAFAIRNLKRSEDYFSWESCIPAKCMMLNGRFQHVFHLLLFVTWIK